jgi:uncharacterized membrane protein
VGRLKIKKKETILPFRQTMAYRMMLLTVSILFFVYTVYEMSVSLLANNTVAFIISVLVGLVAAFAVFHNLDQLRKVKIPAKTLKRMNRR